MMGPTLLQNECDGHKSSFCELISHEIREFIIKVLFDGHYWKSKQEKNRQISHEDEKSTRNWRKMVALLFFIPFTFVHNKNIHLTRCSFPLLAGYERIENKFFFFLFSLLRLQNILLLFESFWKCETEKRRNPFMLLK
jgi:hypothetical protein